MVRGAGGWYFSFPGLVASHTACPGERSTCRPARPCAAGRGPPGTGFSGPWGLGYDPAPHVRGSTAGSQAGLCPEPPGHTEPRPGSADGRGHVPPQRGRAAPRVPRLGARLGGLQAEAAEGREGYEFTSVGNGPRPARLLSGDVLGRFMSQVPWPSGYCPGPAGEWGHRLGSALRGRWSWAAGRAWQIPGRSG